MTSIHAPVTRSLSAHRRIAMFTGVLVASCAMLVANEASAQMIIKNPNQHQKYSVELEPHGILWFNNAVHDYWDSGTGWGAGMRASIPLVDNGFVPSINNNVAIGFGLDWGHYSHRCWGRYYDPRYRDYYGDCSSNTLWAPVVMQWNFFISKIFNAFVEPGIAIRHTWWKDSYCYDARRDPYLCAASGSDTGVHPVGFIGGRVGGEKVTFTFRVGYPYLTLGASFFL